MSGERDNLLAQALGAIEKLEAKPSKLGVTPECTPPRCGTSQTPDVVASLITASGILPEAITFSAVPNATAGWSSIPFGATPVCPCTWSKKPTPEMVAFPERLVKDDVGEPHAVTSRLLALRILALARRDAPLVQDALGNSTIIVPEVVTPLMTR